MLKNVRKSKILLSLIAIILMIVLFGNVYSLATSDNGSNTVTITATTDNTAGSNNTTNTDNTNNNSSNNTNVAPITATANNTSNNTNNNTSTYNNTNSVSNSSGLPYTGTNSKTILLVIAFAISAVYAYKKVSDYNV